MSSEVTGFVVSEEIFELSPGLRLPVAVTDGIEADAEYPEVQEFWQRAWAEASREAFSYGNAQSHPRVAAWREAMSAIGVSGRKFPSSIESLLRRALKGDEPLSINPLEAVMNLIRNGLGMRKTETAWDRANRRKPHRNAVFSRVHNTL